MIGATYNDIMKCERARTGNYGEDYLGGEDFIATCPICGAENPDRFYVPPEKDEVFGCSECIIPITVDEAIDLRLYEIGGLDD